MEERTGQWRPDPASYPDGQKTMGNDAICMGRIIQKEQVWMQGLEETGEGVRNGST